MSERLAPNLPPHSFRSVGKCWEILDRPLRRSWLWLAPLGVVGAFLDILTATLLLRMVATTGGGGAAAGLLGRWLDLMPDTTAGVLAVICAVIVLKTWLRLVETRWREGLSERTVAALARHTLDRWLHAPLRSHLAVSSQVIVEDIQSSANTAGRDGIASLVLIFSEGLVVLALGATLVLSAPLTASGLLVFLGGLAALTLHLVHRRHAHWGEEMVSARPALQGFVQSVIAGIREIRISGTALAFLDRFDRVRSKLGRPQVHIDTWRQTPLFLLEALFLIGACLLLLLFKNQAALPLLVITLYAAMRMLPAINRLIYRFFALQNSLAAAARITGGALPETQKTVAVPSSAPLAFNQHLRLDRVGFTYPGGTQPALADVSLTLHAGERLAIVGPSGHGKSTLLLLLAGLVGADQGTVLLDGAPLSPDDGQWHRLLGFVGQDAPLIDDTVEANIALGVAPESVDRQALANALAAAQLTDVLKRLPLGLNTPLDPNRRLLSGGEHQRIALARALYRQPRLLLLDEATAFLDQPVEQAVLTALNTLSPRPTVVFITHRLATAQTASRVIFVRNGRIEASGAYADLMASHPGFALFAAATDPKIIPPTTGV